MEIFSHRKCRALQSDGANEFLSQEFQKEHNDNGIFHGISCPHTLKQNGSAERKHIRIIDMNLTLLAHSYLPP